jgi:hypothetical protein
MERRLSRAKLAITIGSERTRLTCRARARQAARRPASQPPTGTPVERPGGRRRPDVVEGEREGMRRTITPDELARLRLRAQRLAGERLRAGEEVVGWLVAVQAQDYAGAKWSLGQRARNLTDDGVDAAFNAGRILRTHVLRPTWHFVLPGDIRSLLALTAPRVNAANAYMYRKLELDERTLMKTQDVIGAALGGGRHLTRRQLAEVLRTNGIEASGQRLAYIVMRAELDALVCSGPRNRKQFTYALHDARPPPARALERDEALGGLVLG